MTRVPVHTVDPRPRPAANSLKSLEARFGKGLNIHGAIAHSPLVLDAYAALQHSIEEHGTLDGRTREAIALVVALSTSAPTARRRTRRAARPPA